MPPSLLPNPSLRTGSAQSPLTEWHDQSGRLGDRDEARRRDVAAIGARPAAQGLDTLNAAVPESDDRLIEKLKRAEPEGLAQPGLEPVAGLELEVHIGRIAAILPPPVALRTIERNVGIPQQLIRVGGVIRK